MAEATAASVLVDPAISAAKLKNEIDLWRAHDDLHRRRGLILTRHEDLEVDLLVLARCAPMTLAATAVRLRFDNYDLWPPSLIFTDPYTGDPLPPGVMPAAGAFDMRENPPRPLIPGPHYDGNRAFLCVPGVREYHAHPEHSGDHWLRHRGTGAGTLLGIAATLHKTVAAPVRIGVQMAIFLGPNQPDVNMQVGLVAQRPDTPGTIE